ncbi:MAG: peptidoglycan DD-metalloendopeptidase family protein [Saprospiraceae bacterium]|nr:peptidoglycan DD-metalloendopeptidase family protein [Saprospiraceae bacterium]
MRRLISIYSILIFIILSVINANCQSRQELEKQRLKIIKDIEKTSKALEATKKTKQKNVTQLKVLEQQMDSRKKLLSNIQTEIKLNEKTIEKNLDKIESLKLKHDQLKLQYASILHASYLNKLTNSKWSYILSSDNLNSIFIRWRYINQFDNFTRQKLRDILSITGEIKSKNIEIEKTKEDNLNNLKETSKNVLELEKEQKEKDQIIKKLSKEEENLKITLRKNELERENLNTAIEKIILSVLAKSREKEKDDVAVIKKKEIDNSDFSKNKGALNWPVTKGFISGQFGTHPHPSIKNVKISNNGVDFTLPAKSDVTCVYDGEVVGVTTIPGFNTMIIIKHGSYYSVYSKLEHSIVSKGQKIKRGQQIGQVSPGDDGQTELHFELWKDKSKLDPQKWFNR